MTELFTAIFNSGGILSLFMFISLLINLGLAGVLIKKAKNTSNKSLEPQNFKVDTEIERMLALASTDHLKQMEKMLAHVKNELQLIAVNETQPIREMLLKISSAIELLAKAIEFATQRDSVSNNYTEKRK